MPESFAPKEIAGAFVVCYAGAPDHLEAVRSAYAKLRHDNLEFIDMAGEVQELDPMRWDDYVTASWIEFFRIKVLLFRVRLPRLSGKR